MGEAVQQHKNEVGQMANKLYAWTEVWEKNYKEDEPTKWYALQGEPHFGYLGLIFGYDVEVVAHDSFNPPNDDMCVETNPPASYKLDEFVVPKLPVKQTPPRGRGQPFIDLEELPYRYPFDASSPTPFASPGVIELTKEEFTRSLSGKIKNKCKNKLYYDGEGSPFRWFKPSTFRVEVRENQA